MTGRLLTCLAVALAAAAGCRGERPVRPAAGARTVAPAASAPTGRARTPGAPDSGPARAVADTAPLANALARGRWLEAAVLRRVYRGAHRAWRLTEAAGLGELGQAVARALAEVPAAHGLDARGYRSREIPRLGAAHTAGRGLAARARLELALADGLARLIRDLGLDNSRAAALARRWRQQRPRPPGAHRAKGADAEGRLWGWRYAGHARRWLLAPATLAAAARTDGAPDPRIFPGAHVEARLAEALRTLQDRRDLERLLAGATPPVRQYDRLVAALARYRAIVAAGGFVRVVRRGPAVTLRQRLAQEGYDAPGLRAAVRDFQRNHQLDPTGVVDRRVRAALDVDAGRRLAAIVRALGRWRSSRAGGAGLEVRINVAGYALEVWRGTERLLRQRVVVGKRHGQRCDEDLERKVPAFATPLQSARIEWLVLAPYWNVTRTIKETELDPERGKDPLYYQKHGYELLHEGTPHERVRQLPGPHNALGLVKFIFPNPHETYLHDTPEKRLFARPRRSFSHGCIRVADAPGLAQVLLRTDGQWDGPEFARLRKAWNKMRFEPLREQWDAERYAELVERGATLRRLVRLRRPIPIHVEYHLVHVDDRGRAAFYPDVYRLERPRRWRRCTPDSVRARRGFAALLERLAKLEQGLGELDKRVTAAVAAGKTLLPEGAKLPPAQRRLRRRLAALERFAEDHKNLVQRIRDEHATVAPKGRWRPRRVAQVVRVQRLLDALVALQVRARRACDRLEQLQAAQRSRGASSPAVGGQSNGDRYSTTKRLTIAGRPSWVTRSSTAASGQRTWSR